MNDIKWYETKEAKRKRLKVPGINIINNAIYLNKSLTDSLSCTYINIGIDESRKLIISKSPEGVGLKLTLTRGTGTITRCEDFANWLKKNDLKNKGHGVANYDPVNDYWLIDFLKEE